MPPATSEIAQPRVSAPVRRPQERVRVRRPATLQEDLRNIVGDGVTFSVMVGLGESYVAAFVLALGLGEIAAGLVVTIPMLIGAVLQLSVMWGIHYFRSYRKWIVLCASGQALSLAILPLGALLVGASPRVVLVYAAMSIYWAAGLATGPAWNAWVEDLVPRSIRAPFFSMRARLGHAAVLGGFLAGGLALHFGAASSRLLVCFAVIFVGAAIFRAMSAWFLGSQSEPRAGRIDEQMLSLRQLVHRLRNSAGGRVLMGLFAMQTAVFISGPFYAPFMLEKLKFTYLDYTLLIALAFLGKFAALPFWGRTAARIGARKLLVIAGFGIVPVGALWVFCNATWYLAVLQFIGGSMWAAYELATFLIFFDTIPRRERTSILAIYNLGNAVAMTVGSLVGSFILWQLGESPMVYYSLFALSSLGRLSAVPLLMRVPPGDYDPRLPESRTLSVQPQGGAVDAPIYPTVE